MVHPYLYNVSVFNYFYGWIIFSSIGVSNFAYLFISWWTFRFILLFWLLWIILLWKLIYRFCMDICFHFLGYITRCWIVKITLIFHFEELPNCFPHWLNNVIFLPAMCESSYFSCTHPCATVLSFWTQYLSGCKTESHCGIALHFLMTKKRCGIFFHVFIGHLCIFFGEIIQVLFVHL